MTGPATRGPVRRDLLSLFSGAPPTDRAHVALRWWWCPVPAVETAVPSRGDVLEVGCGHGVVSCWLALAAPARRVRGVDIDPGKIAVAATAAERLPPWAGEASFEVVGPEFMPAGRLAAVVLCDLLYLLREEDQRRLVIGAAGCLEPGGALVVKEMAETPRWKARWNRVQETLATRLLPVTASATASFDLVAPERLGRWMTEAGLNVERLRLDRGRPWPHELIVGRRAG